MTVREVFYSGNWTLLTAQLEANPSFELWAQGPDWATWVGVMAFLGQIPEAEQLYRLGLSHRPEPESLVEARLYLAIGYNRRSDYEKSKKRIIENLIQARTSCSWLVRAFGYYGAAYTHFYESRFFLAERQARAAHQALLADRHPFLQVLIFDLMAHLGCVGGKIQEGFGYFRNALKGAKLLQNDGLQASIEGSLFQYRVYTGREGDRGVSRLQEKLESLPFNDTYSRANLRLELAKQWMLLGKASQASRVLDEVCDEVYLIQHRRLSAELNLRLAEMMVLQNSSHPALSLLKTVEGTLHPTVDRSLRLQILGTQLKIYAQLGLEAASESVRLRLEPLQKRHGNVFQTRIAKRSNPDASAAPILRGEDPFGDLLDDISEGVVGVEQKVVELGYLGLLPKIFGLNPSLHAWVIDVRGKRLISSFEGDVEVIPVIWNATLLKLLRCTEQGIDQKDELVRSVWGYKYHPIRHDPLIYSTVSRLRKVLGTQGEYIQLKETGYRLKEGLQLKWLEDRPTSIEKKARAEERTWKEWELNHRQIHILDRLRSSSQMTYIGISDHARQQRTSKITACRDLSELCEKGYLRRVGRARATKYCLKTP